MNPGGDTGNDKCNSSRHQGTTSTSLAEELVDGKCSRVTNLDCLGRLQRLLWRDAHLPLPQELLGEVGDVASCDGNVLYTAADDIALGLRENERDRERG